MILNNIHRSPQARYQFRYISSFVYLLLRPSLLHLLLEGAVPAATSPQHTLLAPARTREPPAKAYDSHAPVTREFTRHSWSIAAPSLYKSGVCRKVNSYSYRFVLHNWAIESCSDGGNPILLNIVMFIKTNWRAILCPTESYQRISFLQIEFSAKCLWSNHQRENMKKCAWARQISWIKLLKISEKLQGGLWINQTTAVVNRAQRKSSSTIDSFYNGHIKTWNMNGMSVKSSNTLKAIGMETFGQLLLYSIVPVPFKCPKDSILQVLCFLTKDSVNNCC